MRSKATVWGIALATLLSLFGQAAMAREGVNRERREMQRHERRHANMERRHLLHRERARANERREELTERERRHANRERGHRPYHTY